jgi:hypothetical protein
MAPMTMSPAMTFVTTAFIAITFIMAISMPTATGAIIITGLIITTAWAAITYYRLTVPVTSITGISHTVVIKVGIWPWAAANHFITAIKIIAAATRR